jgi:TetR/AcrR family transcriptional repressor of lmrAB and yxaGH operons
MAMATISGALVQMRVQKSAAPLLDAAAELELLFETAVPNRRPG